MSDMITDLISETVESLRPVDYARKWWVPRHADNKPISTSTMYRWIKRGVKGVKLRALYTTAGAVTSEVACKEFLSRVDAARRAELQPTEETTPEQLAAAGLLPKAAPQQIKTVTELDGPP